MRLFENVVLVRALACVLLSAAFAALPAFRLAAEEARPATATVAQPPDPFGATVAQLTGQLRLSAGTRYWYSTGVSARSAQVESRRGSEA